ncbi:MAG: hypothetical protein AB1374_07880 [Bacillota bacterium]
MKRYLLVFLLLAAVFAVGPPLDGNQAVGTAEGSALGPARVEIKTDKKYYLMDPYYWVYSAAKADLPGPAGNPHWWPEDGYSRTVYFTVYVGDLSGNPMDVEEGVVYDVVYNGGRTLKEGSTTYIQTGVYSGSFMLSEGDLGRESFTGWEPKELTVRAKIGTQIIKRQPIHIGRWGCDRCHLESNLAKSIYPWCAPTGGYWGPHGWYGQLGGAGSSGEMFDLSNLTDPEKTHTPGDLLTGTYGHEYTIQKQCGNSACSPCHQGSGRLRYPWYTPPYYTHPGEKVECTYCHGIEGGYLPSGVLDWSSTMSQYFNNWAKGSKWKDNAGFSALHGDCTNAHCHGRINDDAEGEINVARPVCRDCHAVP